MASQDHSSSPAGEELACNGPAPPDNGETPTASSKPPLSVHLRSNRRSSVDDDEVVASDDGGPNSGRPILHTSVTSTEADHPNRNRLSPAGYQRANILTPMSSVGDVGGCPPSEGMLDAPKSHSLRLGTASVNTSEMILAEPDETGGHYPLPTIKRRGAATPDDILVAGTVRRGAGRGHVMDASNLPNLLEDEEEKEAALAKLQRKFEEKRAELEKIKVYPPIFGEMSWWHFSTAMFFMLIGLVNVAINIKIAVSDCVRPVQFKEVFDPVCTFLKAGFAKDVARVVLTMALLLTPATLDRTYLKWGYAYVAHSPCLLVLFFFNVHRARLIPALSLINHPKIVAWDIFFGDVPSAIITFLLNYIQNQYIPIVPALTVSAIFVTTFFRLTRFLWIALLLMNEYGQNRARSLRLLKHLYQWGRGLEYYIVVLGEDMDKGRLLEHIQSRAQEFQVEKAKHIQDAWVKGFRSIIVLNTLQAMMSLLSGIYRYHLDKDPEVAKHVAEFEGIVKDYEPELLAMRNKALWKLHVRSRHVELIKKLWNNGLVRIAHRKFSTVIAEKWHERRFTRLLGAKDIMDDPHQITSLLSSSLEVDEYCLNNAERILEESYEPSPEDLAQIPISLTEMLFTELGHASSYHVKDRVLANNVCILDVPKSFSRSRLQALIPFCQTLIIFLDMNKFDEMVEVTRVRRAGFSAAPASPKVPESKEEAVPYSELELNRFSMTEIVSTTVQNTSSSIQQGSTTRPRLLIELEFFERICTTKDKSHMVTGILVFWKNYSAFKSRINSPGTLVNFPSMYTDYQERTHGALNGPNVLRYFKRRILRAANPRDRYVSIIPDWELNKRFDLFSTLNEVIFDHYVVHRVT